jgi:membrane protease YdiL (CAAX protease family)
MAVRAVIYHFMPVTSLETWFVRDTVMSLPRLVGFVSLLLLNRYRWKTVPFDIRVRDWERPALLGGILIALHTVYWAGSGGPLYPRGIAAGALVTTVFVGLFEEYAFRGTLLSGLRGLISPLQTVILSNVAFTVYHVQAQRVSFWPSIFLIGAILACMRLRGVSLFWLAAVHIVIDDVYFFVGLGMPSPFSMHNIVFNICLLAFAVLLLPRRPGWLPNDEEKGSIRR